MSYVPNTSDQRVRNNIIHALNWAKITLNTKHGAPVHSARIQKNLGNRNQPLGKFLYENLLLLDSKFYTVGKKAMTYTLNQAGYDMIEKMVYGEVKELSEVRKQSIRLTAEEMFPELKTLEFEYKDKSQRLWHELQNLPSDVKEQFWADYLPFDYDIEAAAPTMLIQYATKLGLSAKNAAPIRNYLDNKNTFREHVAELTGLDIKVAKRLITSLFNGARLTANEFFCSAFETINFDVEVMTRLQNDEQINELRKAIALMWKAIGSQEQVKSSKEKWVVYYTMERKVLDATKEFLSKEGIKFFTEHDGFRSDREVNTDELSAFIFSRTDIQVKFSGDSKSNHPSTLCGIPAEQKPMMFTKTRKSFRVDLFLPLRPSRIKQILNNRRWNRTSLTF